MERVKRKIIIGVIFALAASLVSVLIQYHQDFWELVKFNANTIGLNFLLYFLAGYVLIGNLFTNKKAN
ncbi:hypothetical protein [Wenyingzhuangia marina]|uniref:Uncharacterized protein n=1 Tax=Wenyingzhuangia marina TaxID=1195760 RepID=A0A1M5U3D5_9FLAO|nr:hypothetical protein [Wenyingzhuangia marina]GGF69888.1 hypothetical protein GCM10011397_11010 [Wenyingzhuangia marina]SHH57193.1 hypothetical protein SAMN05444281_0995 [Wenyingzhuangia marina]